MHTIVYEVMDRLCDATGHDLFLCWNRGEGRIRNALHRLWVWSLDLEKEES
jgi:hypothetical protein